MSRGHTQSGFTLIEMLIVIGLLGLLATLALLALGEPARTAALNNSYATVRTALESARTKAVQGYGNGTGGQSISVSANGKTITTESGTFDLAPHVTITETGTTLEFSRISGATTPTTLTLVSGSDSQIIHVTAEGYVY